MPFCLQKLKASGKLAKMRVSKIRALEAEDAECANPVNDIVSCAGRGIDDPVAIVDDEMDDGNDWDDQLETDEDNYYDDDEEYYDESPRDDDGQSFQRGLRNWALSSNIPHVHINSLLLLIRNTTKFYVPKDARTFLKTPVRVGRQIAHLAGGQLWYQGIKTALQNYFCKIKPTVDGFEINLSMDGLPMHNSGPTQLWPILMQLHNIVGAPVLVVGVFCGASKPTNCEDYLRPLVDELNELLLNDLHIQEKMYSIQLRAIIADTPARAFIKGVAYHNAIHACQKCKCVGIHVKEARKVIYEDIHAEKRTDEEFRGGQYAKHYVRTSPVLDIKNFDVVQDVIVGDRLHLIDQGVMRKLLKGWVDGALSPYPAWKSEQKKHISNALKDMEIPSEINRQMRSLKFLPQWKGTEMRTFLHYASIAILPEMLRDDAFHHFKLFFCAVTMLSSNHYKQYWEYAGTLLTAFVEQFSNIYSRNHLTSNIHNLIHVSEEVCRFGPLDSMSTYPFENKLQIIKNSVRGGSRTLEQIICRITERIEMEIEEENNATTYPALKIRNQEVILNISERFMLRKGNKDGWFLTKSNAIAQYDSASETAGAITIHCRALLNQSPAFSYPCSAEILYIYKADMADISPTVTTLDVWDVKCKLVVAKTSQQGDARFTPLLHTLEWDS
uniref:Transposase domain-containing protein n=1 Tax=Anopheles atroparvus TaxID=41427 RepID=A0AAG5DM47_ANOAO